MVAGETRPGGKHVQRHDARVGIEVARELERLGCECPNTRVVAVTKGDSAESDECERRSIGIVDLAGRFERSFVSLARIALCAGAKGE